MTEPAVEARAPSGAERPAGSTSYRVARWAFPLSQWLSVPLALYLGLRGYRLIDGFNEQEGIDRAAGYFGSALLLMAYFAWDGHLPAPLAWPGRAAAYVRAHPVELLALAGICAAGAFMRLWWYGDLPPDGYLVLEEHINTGIAWDILHGARPYIYPIPRYLGALSLKVFGPTTDGVRGHSVITGVLCVPAFYLMMREATDRPSALFATGIFASLRVLGDTLVHFQSPMLFQILMVWMALRGLRTGVLLWFVPAAACGVLLSYEYETSKALPLFFAAFLGWIVIRRLAWPIPRGATDEWQRVKTYAPAAIKVAVIIGVIFIIGLSPIVAQSHRGQNVYFASLDRQRGDREGRGTPGLFAPDWEQQLKKSAQVLTPWVEPDYAEISSIEARGAIDRLTSLLLWAAVLSGIVFFWRGYRALFIGWFLGGMLFSSLLLSTWAPWKTIGWLLPATALTAFLAEDAAWLLRRYWRPGLRALPVALTIIVATVFLLNARTLRANADDARVLREYANTPSQQFAICDRLRDRPDGTYAYVSQRVRGSWGWSRPPTGDVRAEAISWGDFRFVCMGLHGASAATLSEIWPISAQPGAPQSLVQTGDPGEMARIAGELTQVMPELGAAALEELAPADIFELLLYDASADQLNARQGLELEWLDEQGSVIGEHVVPAATFKLGDAPPSAVSYRLHGLVYLADDDEATLTLTGAPAETSVSIDQDALPGLIFNSPLAAMRGWHLVEIEGAAREGTAFSLAWQRGADEQTIAARDLFALPDTDRLWRHERTYQLPGGGDEFTALRYDLNPHYAAFDGLRVAPDEPLPFGTRALSERWSGSITVDEPGTYRLFLSAFRQRFELLIDGTDPLPGDASRVDQAYVDLLLTSGDHSIEIRFEPAGEDVALIGGALGIAVAASGEEVQFAVRPY